jgi:excisionase family DNA binding protein
MDGIESDLGAYCFLWGTPGRDYRARRGKESMKALKSIEQAAGLLGISKWTVRSYIKAGKLKPVRLGRRVLLGEEELERFIAVNSESTPIVVGRVRVEVQQ